MLVTAVAFEAQSVSTAMPAVASDLGQLDLYAWAFSAFMIPQMVAIVVGGRLSDRFGPVLPLRIGVVVFAVGLILSASAWSMPMFLAGRFVQGMGGGLINLSLMVVVGRAFPPEETGRVMTWFSFAWMLPSFIGPSAAAWIVSVASWHWVFWAVLPFVALGIALLTPALANVDMPPLVSESDAARAPLWAAFGAAVGVALVQAAGQELQWWSAPLAMLGLVAIIVSLRPLMPAGWRPLAKGLPAVIPTRALATGAFFGFVAFQPLMLNELHGYGLEVGGIVLTIASLGWTAGSWLQSRPWLRLSRDAIVSTGVVLVSVGLTVVAVFTLSVGWPLPVLVAGGVVAGAGMGLTSSSTSVLVIQLSDAHQLGHNTSSLQVAEAMGNALIVGLAGTLFAAFASSPALSFGAPAVLVAGCAWLAFAASRRIGHVENLSARLKPS